MDQNGRPQRKRTDPKNNEDVRTETPAGGARQPEPGAGLDADIQAQIGLQLRAIYEDVLNQATPERFLKLLENLDKQSESG